MGNLKKFLTSVNFYKEKQQKFDTSVLDAIDKYQSKYEKVIGDLNVPEETQKKGDEDDVKIEI